MTPAAVIAFLLFCAAWRLAKGGVPNIKGLARHHRWAGLLAPAWDGFLAAAGFLAVYGVLYMAVKDHLFAALNAGLFLLYWNPGHGAMLRFPLNRDDNDFILYIVMGGWRESRETPARWWLYAGIRYIFTALIWTLVVAAVGEWLGRSWPVMWPMAIGGFLVCCSYRYTAPRQEKLSYGWVRTLGGVPAADPIIKPDGSRYHDEVHMHYAEPDAGLAIAAAIAAGVMLHGV